MSDVDPYGGTGGTSLAGDDKPVTDNSFWSLPTDTSVVGIAAWASSEAVMVSGGAVSAAKGTVAAVKETETKLEQKIAAVAGYAAEEHERANDSLKYVAWIVTALGVVYVVTLVAPGLMNASSWVPKKK